MISWDPCKQSHEIKVRILLVLRWGNQGSERAVPGLPSDPLDHQVNNDKNRNQISALILGWVHPLLKVRWLSSTGGDAEPQRVKLVLFKHFSPKIKTGPYVWSRDRLKGGGQKTSAMERRTQFQESGNAKQVFQDQSPGRHSHWDGKGAWWEEKEWWETEKER